MSLGVSQRQGRASSPVTSMRARRVRPAVLRIVLPALLLAGAIAVVAYPFWPGRMNADTIVQIEQTMSGVYSNQYDPILLVMWHPFLRAGFGPGWVLTLQLVVFAWGAHTLLRRWFSPLAAAAVTVVVMLTPEGFGEFGLVGRDALFLGLLVSCFACSARALDASSSRRRWAWLGGALVFAWLTLASRQNAGTSVFLPLAVVVAPWISRRLRSPRLRRLRVVILATIAGMLVTLAMIATQSGLNRALSVQNMNPTAIIYLYDLSAMSRLEHRDLIPASVMPAHSLAKIEALTGTLSANELIASVDAPVRYPVSNRHTAALRRAWLSQIKHHPGDYLQERTQDFELLAGLTGPSIWVYHPYVDPNTLGYSNTHPGAESDASRYMRAFTDAANNGEMPFLPWPYLLACMVIVIGLLRTRARDRVLLLALALAAVTYQVGLFFGLMGANYVYEFPAIIVAELAVVIALRVIWDDLRGRRTAGASPMAAR